MYHYYTIINIIINMQLLNCHSEIRFLRILKLNMNFSLQFDREQFKLSYAIIVTRADLCNKNTNCPVLQYMNFFFQISSLLQNNICYYKLLLLLLLLLYYYYRNHHRQQRRLAIIIISNNSCKLVNGLEKYRINLNPCKINYHIIRALYIVVILDILSQRVYLSLNKLFSKYGLRTLSTYSDTNIFLA